MRIDAIYVPAHALSPECHRSSTWLCVLNWNCGAKTGKGRVILTGLNRIQHHSGRRSHRMQRKQRGSR